MVKRNEVLQCSDGLSNKMPKIIRRHIDKMKFLRFYLLSVYIRGVVNSSRTEFFSLVRSVVTTPASRGIIPNVSWASVLKANFLCASCVTQL